MLATDNEVFLIPQAGKLEITYRDRSFLPCDISNAMATANIDENPPLYRLLRRLKPDDLTEAEWARIAKVSSSFFQDVKKGRRPRSDTLEKVVEAIGMSMAQFHALEAPVGTEVAGIGLHGAGDLRRAFHGEKPLPALPLLGTAIAGDHQDLDDDVELVELNLSDVLDYLVRPASLARDPDAYALNILTDSMAPKFEPGDAVAVSPKTVLAIRDYVIVQLRGASGEDERIKMVLLKRLVRRGATFIELEQFNPPKIFRVEARRVAAMHKVMGTIF